ncbi:hypothetical protein [Arthrobacter sp. LFS091]|uniref:hypothetical protein n=1 Tax=Arthrobacter sp. LFS091 TaxID=3229892 RepID=UPI003A80828E
MKCPPVGNIELTGDALEIPGEGLTLIAYTAETGSHADSWNAAAPTTSKPLPSTSSSAVDLQE